MEVKTVRIPTVKEIKDLKVDGVRPLFSATHEEIISGLTSDVYFFRTMEILRNIDLVNVEVTAEIFPQSPGILSGVEETLRLLKGRKVSVWSLDEGEHFDKKEVIMRIEGAYGEFGIYETAILGILASSSAWATAAKECKDAAGGLPVICFGSRHVHPAVAPVMERASLTGGVDGVSCVLAAKIAGMDPSGTMPHALIIILGDTVIAGKKYHEIMLPDVSRVVLVDTFKDEAEESLRVAEALGKNLMGVRLDTPSERGRVTPELVQEVRGRLDIEGYNHVKIFVSGGLNPERIRLLKEAGADAFGVGSYISDAAPIDMTLDLKEVKGRPITKRGRIPGKTNNPRLKKKM